MKKAALMLTAAIGLTLGLAPSRARADQTVQIPIDALLTGRTVTTLTGGVLVTWTNGVDGGGNGNGYETAAASKFHNDPVVKALPDDGKFPADARHPDVVLHFSNDAAATSPQTHPTTGAATFSFAVPPATYSKLFLFVTSAEGSSAVKVTLTYSDATSNVVSITVPDYFNDVGANDPVVFNLASNMAKWSKQNTIAEMNHHNLTGLEVHPTAGKTLTDVKVEKTAAGYLVFWGATGIATGAVGALDAGTGMEAGPADATGAAGAGGNAGAAGSGGAGSGAAGSGAGGSGAGGSGAAGSVGGAGGGAAGASGQAGAGAAGTGGPGGASGVSGAAGVGSGGSTGSAGTSGAAGGAAGSSGGANGGRPASSGGCSCQAAGAASASSWFIGLPFMLGLAHRRRRR
jgi:hypothetical protein